MKNNNLTVRNNTMTKEQLAQQLNGREYGNEIDQDQELYAKKSGLVVIFGYSDDNVELRGAIHDEIVCCGGGMIRLHRKGVLPKHQQECECKFCNFDQMAKGCAEVETIWCGKDGYLWTYRTTVPHATFDILEDGEKFCRGIVIDIMDLPDLTQPTKQSRNT